MTFEEKMTAAIAAINANTEAMTVLANALRAAPVQILNAATEEAKPAASRGRPKKEVAPAEVKAEPAPQVASNVDATQAGVSAAPVAPAPAPVAPAPAPVAPAPAPVAPEGPSATEACIAWVRSYVGGLAKDSPEQIEVIAAVRAVFAEYKVPGASHFTEDQAREALPKLKAIEDSRAAASSATSLI